jgi:exonuclease SbcD
MRILHFADLHIGVESYSRPDPQTGLSSRLLDFLAALDELVEYALSNDIDLVLFCGDAYKSRDPSQTHQREFAKRIARLTGAGIPVFLLVGNHDVPYALGRASALDIFPTLSVPLVHVGARPETQVIQTRRGEPLQVVAVPWLNRSWLLAQEDFKNLPAGKPLNEVMEQKLDRLLKDLFAELDGDLPAVLSGHLALSDAKTGSEQSMTIGTDPVFMPATLQSHQGKLDYIGLGHIHVQQLRDGLVPMVFPGSMQRVDFGEEGQEKGFYVVDIDGSGRRGDRLRSQEFVPVNARSFVTIDVRSTGGNPTEDVLRTIARRESEVTDAIVRVQVSLGGESASGVLDEPAVRRALVPAHYFAGISRKLDSVPRSRLGVVVIEELQPLDALGMYLQHRGTSEERSRVLMQHAERLARETEESDEAHGG